jgi:UDP-N-acetylmuramyl pentapeptide phosphotransferase/UDP-N-acetylglucosamine-1-phosphate transferase
MENISWYIWVFGGIVPFLLSMVLVFAVHPFVVKIATSRGLTDNPGERKLQQRPVPVLGGVAVFFGIVVGAGVTSMFFNSHALFTSIVAITVMMYIGVLDDMLGLSPNLRLVLELGFVAFVAWMDQVNINDLHGVFGIGMLPYLDHEGIVLVQCVGQGDLLRLGRWIRVGVDESDVPIGVEVVALALRPSCD